jgi:hypothetical protein
MINTKTGLGGGYNIGGGKTTPPKTDTHNPPPEVSVDKKPAKKPNATKISSTNIERSHSDKHQEQLRQASIRFSQAAEKNTLSPNKGLQGKSGYSFTKP